MQEDWGPVNASFRDYHGTVAMDGPDISLGTLGDVVGIDEAEWLIIGIEIEGSGRRGGQARPLRVVEGDAAHRSVASVLAIRHADREALVEAGKPIEVARHRIQGMSGVEVLESMKLWTLRVVPRGHDERTLVVVDEIP